ncbi:hypothetical protein BDF14DRAFT_1880396 [Spinellus fusiger]|nr:hypothetical protein BDF14DRAFT_1880396 [Spinellus fusiger]
MQGHGTNTPTIEFDMGQQSKTDLLQLPTSWQGTTTDLTTLPAKEREMIALVNSQFRIDGQVPQQDAQLAQSHHLEQQDTHQRNAGPGRRRLEGQKGLLMDLIDSIYPPSLCPVCYCKGASRSEIDQHYKLHPGAKAYRCTHPSCHHAYSSRPGLRYHLEHAHTVTMITENNLQCITPKSTSVRGLSRTRKTELPDALKALLDTAYNPMKCPVCQATFKRKTHVVHHLVCAHRGDEVYRCVVTDCKRKKTYATREGLVYHLAKYHSQAFTLSR